MGGEKMGGGYYWIKMRGGLDKKWERLHPAHNQNWDADDNDGGDDYEDGDDGSGDDDGGGDDDDDDHTNIFSIQLQVSIGGNPISLILKLIPQMAATASSKLWHWS